MNSLIMQEPNTTFRLPNTTRIGRVSLQVHSLERSLAYYQELIGLRLFSRSENSASLGTQDGKTELLELHERAGLNPVPRRGRLGLYHFAILLPERAALGRFLNHLAEKGAYAGMSDHLFSEAIYLTDPDGLGIEVYADRPRSQWQYDERSGEIIGDSKALDTASLMQAAGLSKWSGMPAGTVIGHLHFYIDDLAKAAAFYHQGLGFAVSIRSYPGALFVSAGGYHHHIGLNTWAAGALAADSSKDACLRYWELYVDDLQRLSEHLQTQGIKLEPHKDGFLAQDPWGITVYLKNR